LEQVEQVRRAPAEDRGELLDRGRIPKVAIDADEQPGQLFGAP
jgi:hypothetical protein